MVRARAGDPPALAAFDRYVDRLARGLAVVCDLVDPDVIVLGGGMSKAPEIYDRLPGAIAAALTAAPGLARLVARRTRLPASALRVRSGR